MKRNSRKILANHRNQNRRGLSLFLAVFLMYFYGYSQSNMVEKGIRDAFNRYRSGYIQEKLFVHTDKNFYQAGEILWFRIYDVDASFHRPVDISKIAYVELLDKSNKPVLQEKISLKPGEANGSFIIPVSVASGYFRFRAYTRWMRNFNVDYFFEKTIRIINPEKLPADSIPAVADRFDVQFFPEGGNLVQHLESKLGFRVTDAYGKGQDFEGVLLDDRQDTVLKFHPLKLGLGHFSFTPSDEHTYKAILTFPNGKQITKALPVAYPAGYVMQLTPTEKERLAITVQASGNQEAGMVYLFVHTRGSVKKFEGQQLENGTTRFLINSSTLGDGISQFTVFTGSGKPVCERLYFKYPTKKLLLEADAGQPAFSTRKKVQLNLSSADQDGQPVKADLSLAVYQLDSLQSMDETNINHYLYLTSDLGNGIESPEYYFKDDGNAKEEAMDNLMLTQGWRRFIWDDIGQNQVIKMEYSPEYNGHILEGKLVNNKTGVAVADIATYLSVPSGRTQFRTTTSDQNGHIKFEMKDFYGSQEIILQTNPKEDSTCHFEMTSPFAKKYAADPLPDFFLPSINSQEVTDQSVQIQVQHIYYGNKLQQFIMPGVDTNTFYVTPDEKYLLDDYTRFQTMEEVLREYVMSVDVVRKHDKFQLYAYNNSYRKFFTGPPLILMDGVPVFDADKLFHQDPLKVRRLDLITEKYFLGYQPFNGVVNVTTYHGDLDGFEMDPHATVLDYPGIPGEREFFTPVYETEQQISSRMPDFRSLLYWAPRIKTGVTGKEEISFYTSDLAGKYAVVVQGITATGQPGSRVIYFTVKK